MHQSPLPARPSAPTFGESPLPGENAYGTPYSTGEVHCLAKLRGTSSVSLQDYSPYQGLSPSPAYDTHLVGGGDVGLYGLSPPASAVTRAMDNIVSCTEKQQHVTPTCFETPRTTLRARVTRDKVLNAAVVMSSPSASTRSGSSGGFGSDGGSPPPHLDRKGTGLFCPSSSTSYVTPNRSRQAAIGSGGKEVPSNFLTPQQGFKTPLSEVNTNVMPQVDNAASKPQHDSHTFLTTVNIPSAVKTTVPTTVEELTTTGMKAEHLLMGNSGYLPNVLGGLTPSRFMTAQQEANAAVARSILLASPPQRVHGNGRIVQHSPQSASPQVSVSPEQMKTMEGDSVSLLKRKHLQRMVQVGFEHPGALMSPGAKNRGPAPQQQTKVAFTPHPPPRKPKA